MKILVLSTTFPLPANTGTKLRVYNTLKELSRKNHLHLVSLVHEKSEFKYVDDLKKNCETIYPLKLNSSKAFSIIRTIFSRFPYRVNRFKHREFGKQVRQLIQENEFDVIWVNSMNMGVYLDKNSLSNEIVVLDQHNVDELVWRKLYENSDNFIVKRFGRSNAQKHIRLREKLVELFDVSLSVCQEDAEFTRRWAPNSLHVWVAPNGVDTEYFKPTGDTKEENIIMFCGSMSVNMNIDAVDRFAKQVFPSVKQEIPDCEFWIVGKDPVPKVKALENYQGIKVTGTVADVSPYYEKAVLFVAPFRFGGGTKLKILESMAAGIPIVSTDVGCQGIEVINGKHIVIENDLNNFAAKVVYLLNNREEGKMVSQSARNLVEEKYSWKGIVNKIESQLENLVQEGPKKDYQNLLC